MHRSHCLLVVLLALASSTSLDAKASKPNIVIILADDMGYGDVRALNPASKIPTPNLDRLAAQGMTFTDSHSPSAVCTPTRYGLLTGRYCWRTRLKTGVLGGYSKPLIDKSRTTIAAMLRASGYRTGAVGKWHLGMNMPMKKKGAKRTAWGGDPGVDFGGVIQDSPIHRGFDSYFGVSASLDMAPYVYIRDDRFTKLPTLQQKAIPFPHFIRNGPRADDFIVDEILDKLAEEAVAFIDSAAKGDKPFFLYMPLTAPHKPTQPHARFKGKTKLGEYGDFILQVDWTVGHVLEALDKAKVRDDTLVVFTSDNGSYMYRYDDPKKKDHVDSSRVQGFRAENHRPNGPFRGTKADVWEAGHHVPFFARWPGRVKAGSKCDEPICHTDLFATCAEIVGQKLGPDVAEDSLSLVKLLDGQDVRRGAPVINHSIGGMFAIRDGKWKLVAGNGSGGRQKPRGRPFAKPFHLFDLEADIGETTNVAAKHPDVVERLTTQLTSIRKSGRSVSRGVSRSAGTGRKAATGGKTAAGKGKRPNIVFIFTDDHAPHAIGAYGGILKKIDPTPNIDRLASQGMIFRKSFCTNSICGPSRAVIQTGKHNHLNGFMHNGNRFDGDQQTFPKLLRKVGYQTAMIGKWHLKSKPQGFDYWRVLPGQGDYYNPDFLTPDGKKRINGYCTDLVTDMALEWMKTGRDKDKPFILMCQHKAPHRTWMPAERHLTLYDDITLPEPATLFDRYEDNASPARYQEMEIDRHMHLVFDLKVGHDDKFEPKGGVSVDRSGFRNLKKMTKAQRAKWDAAYGPKNKAFLEAKLSGKELVRWKYQRYMKDYLRCIKGVDESVGKILSYLEESGLDENTIVVYSSDQGFYLGDHGWYDKRWMYEESLAMPLIVRWPGVTKPGSENFQLVQNLDYAQTFLEVAGAEIPADMQGRSLVPLLRGEQPADWRKSIYYHYYEFPSVHMVARHYGIRTERHKLIRFYHFDEWELYDLEKDPEELTNLYGKPEHAGITQSLKDDLEKLREHYKDDTDVSVKPLEWRQKFRPEAK
jgi:arylsulfatase A-like enzyme